MAEKLPKMAQKLAQAEKNSTDITATSVAFCIPDHPQDKIDVKFIWPAGRGNVLLREQERDGDHPGKHSSLQWVAFW